VKRIWLLIPLGLLLSACGGGSNKAATTAAPALQTVQISEKEFSITPSTVSLTQTGTYSFKVTNNGQITHAFEINGQRTSDIPPGQSATLTVNLSKKGMYDAYCPIDGHRSKGMDAKIAVAAPGASQSTPTTTTTPTSSSPGY